MPVAGIQNRKLCAMSIHVPRSEAYASLVDTKAQVRVCLLRGVRQSLIGTAPRRLEYPRDVSSSSPFIYCPLHTTGPAQPTSFTVTRGSRTTSKEVIISILPGSLLLLGSQPRFNLQLPRVPRARFGKKAQASKCSRAASFMAHRLPPAALVLRLRTSSFRYSRGPKESPLGRRPLASLLIAQTRWFQPGRQRRAVQGGCFKAPSQDAFARGFEADCPPRRWF